MLSEFSASGHGGLTIRPAQSRAFNDLLTELAETLPARLVLLTQTSGQAVSFVCDKCQTRGNGTDIDIVALGALVAGDLAASQAIARITGEYQDYQIVLRQGQNNHIFISEVGDSLALLVQVGNAVPLGWARLSIVDTARRLAEIVAHSGEDAEELELELALALNQSNGTEALNDALNSLWGEESDVR